MPSSRGRRPRPRSRLRFPAASFAPSPASSASRRPPGDVAGPIGIAQQTGRLLDATLAAQLFFVGLLSINLAVLNILPFPPLDGGRVLIVLIEAVRRRRLSAEREALIYFTGFVVLIALVILISIQDIARLPGS